MKKAMLVGLLLVFAWTSVVGAQADATVLDPADFLYLENTLSKAPRMIDCLIWWQPFLLETESILAYDGNDWVVWTDIAKTWWVVGFMGGTQIASMYVSAGLRQAGVPTQWLFDATEMPFRVGVYVLELDALYREPENRPIALVSAIHIANERLNGRDVDLTPWRNKGREQQDT